MIEYNRNAWWRNSFSFSGTVLPNVLGRVGLLTALTLGLCALDQFVLAPHGFPMPTLDQLGHTVLGIAMSMLIVFRTNTSYSRYWDARTYWGGLINGARNLCRLGATYAPPSEELARLVTAYAVAVRQTLRGSSDLKVLTGLVSGRTLARAAAANNPPTVLAAAISEWIDRRRSSGALETFQAMEMERVLNQMVEQQGGCERILRSPLPFVYATLIKQLLLIYLATLPFVLVGKMGFVAPLVVAVVSFGMLGIEEAGIEIEAPFSTDPNALPLEQLCTTIARDTAALSAEEHAAV